jgi:hypothetical protein
MNGRGSVGYELRRCSSVALQVSTAPRGRATSIYRTQLASVNVFRILIPVTCLLEHHAMKAYWGAEVWLHAFLTPALDGGEWSGSRPSRFTPRERALGTRWIGGWVGLRAVLEAVVKRKIPSSCWDSNPWSSSP